MCTCFSLPHCQRSPGGFTPAREGSVNLGLGELLPQEDLSGLPPLPTSSWWGISGMHGEATHGLRTDTAHPYQSTCVPLMCVLSLDLHKSPMKIDSITPTLQKTLRPKGGYIACTGHTGACLSHLKAIPGFCQEDLYFRTVS